jgi:hypothetical protein
MAIPFFNSRQFLLTINSYILRDKAGNILEIGVPENELVQSDIGKRLISYRNVKPDLDMIKTVETLLACVADMNARLVLLEDTIAYL